MEPLLCALGLIAHAITILSEVSAARGHMVTPWAFMRERPYKVSLAIIGAIIGYIVLLQMGELSLLTAFGVGYMANDSIDRVGKITASKMK